MRTGDRSTQVQEEHCGTPPPRAHERHEPKRRVPRARLVVCLPREAPSDDTKEHPARISRHHGEERHALHPSTQNGCKVGRLDGDHEGSTGIRREATPKRVFSILRDARVVISCFTARAVSPSHHITSHHITSHHVTSRHITSHHIKSRHVTSHQVTSRHITTHHITSHHITSHHITSGHVTSRQVT